MLLRMEGDIARMNQLVEEILTLARLERGGPVVLKPVEIDLIDLIDPILRDGEFEGQARGVQIRYSGPQEVPMHCDPELMHRAFENILRNALRYAPDASTVDVRVERSEDTRGRMVRLSVTDLGPGVEEAQLSAIFQAFVRDEAGPGIGLGLAIAANAIRLHGGNITARNRPEGGFTITCTIPQN